jgi:ankyrin repeat protein
MRIFLLFCFFNFSFETELIEAIFTNDLRKVQKVFENNPNTNINQVSHDVTALSTAILFRNPKIVQFLIEKNANVNLVFGDSCTALLTASSTNSSIEMIKILVLNKADVNHKAPRGRTPLANTLILNNLENFEFLLLSGANHVESFEHFENILDRDPKKVVLKNRKTGRSETAGNVVNMFTNKKSFEIFLSFVGPLPLGQTNFIVDVLSNSLMQF